MSEYVDKYEKWFFRIFRVIKPPLSKEIGVRSLPRFFELLEYNEGQNFAAAIPVVRPLWFWSGSTILFSMWFLGLPYLGFLSYRGLVVRGGRVFEASFNYPMFITGLVIFALITWLVITQMIIRRIVIRADHEKICVHDRVYYWDRAQGFRLGYSVGGVERVDKVWKYQGIRMSYGPYGDDIPFMVHDFYAPIYVVLLNDLLQAVQPRSVADETAETGIKQVFF